MFDKISKRKAEKLSKEFLPEALEIVENPASPIGHFTIWITIIIFISFLVWSIYGQVDVTANARGSVVTTDGVQIVQAVNAGKVTKIYAKDGDKVKKGDKIIALDSNLEKESLDYSIDSIELLQFKIDLLNEVIADVDISSYLENTKDSDKIEIIEYVMNLQEGRRATIDQYTLELERSTKQLQIEEKNYDILLETEKSLKAEKERLEEIYQKDSVEKIKADKIEAQIKKLEPVVKSYVELYENDAITKSELEDKQKELEDLKNQKEIQLKVSEDAITSQKEEIKKIEDQINQNKIMKKEQEAKLKLEEKNVDISKEALDNATINSNQSISELIVQYNEQIKQFSLDKSQKKYVYDNQIITAPITGTIQKIAVNTIGGVVSQAQSLVEIVPSKSELIIEADVPNKNIGYISLNQEASIKLDTYNFQEYGMLSGKIIEISPDAELDEKKGYIYKVKIKVDKDSFIEKHPECDILSGMECTAEIKTGSRSIIKFFLDPLIKHFDESLKVR